MFSAVDIRDQQRIILLDAVDDDSKAVLRQAAWDGFLHCPVCNQPVIVRFGSERHPHFAHKHLSNCPSSHESPELLQGRKVLYRWLKTKFDTAVSIEKQLNQPKLPRWIDCWIETPKGRKLAYWIVEKNVNPADRETLLDLARSDDIALNFVFLSRMMARNEAPEGVLNLTTTEREFKTRSDYDLIYLTGRYHTSRCSLHYLDAEKERVISFRAMSCTEAPQQYAGTEISSPFAELKVSPVNGEMVHPGEVEALMQRKREIELATEQARRREEEEAARESARAKAEAEQVAEETARLKADAEAWDRMLKPATASADPVTVGTAYQPLRTLYGGDKKEGVCVFCGQRTRSWWRRDGATGQCQCWPCRRNGAFNDGSDWLKNQGNP